MKKNALGLLALAVVLGTGIMFSNSALAYKGNPDVKGPNYSAERHKAMEQAFDNGDYGAWKKLMQGQGRVTQIINESNFKRFAEAHNLAEQGKNAEADKIRQELGLGGRNGSKVGMGIPRGCNR